MYLLSFILLIVILVGIWFAYTSFRKNKIGTTKELTVQERIDKIRTAIKDPKTKLSSNQQSKITTYKNSELDIEKEYKDWNNTSKMLSVMCLDGCKFLEYHLIKNEPVALKIADVMVTKLLEKLGPIEGEVIEVNPWKANWYETSIILTYFLALYVYIGTNKDLIEGSKKQILRIVPSVGVTLKKTLSELNLLKASVSRLCVTYLTPEKFRKDITSAKFIELKNFMNLKHIKDDTVQYGYYDDGSVILNGFATYERLETTLGFYESAYRGMDLPTNIKDLAIKIFPKLTHPNIKYYPLGLLRNNKDRIARSWPWTSSNTEINLIPFIGLGVFKCPEFMFFVRVQKSYIHPHNTGILELTAGCIQIRRIFRKDKTYPRYLTTDNLKDEPGVLSKANKTVCTLTGQGDFYCSDVSSFIGCIDDLMFWKNSYKFNELFGDVTITEAGVISASGFQARYEIKNKTNDAFKFCYTDSEMKHCSTAPGSSQGFVDVPKGTKEFTWTMADQLIDYKITLIAKGMTFNMTSKNKKYKVETIDGDNEPYVVTCDSTIVLGSSSSKISNKINYKGIPYNRNSKTMMYEN
ncbi:hypothetical protein G9C98_003024 [Cotesia typhae]|uniref:Uncharacterized protein n=1 Tax=Cotesia typhae TaxID=2053667 RepID=A0A8J5V7T7_9HYME|nr:hypothetical protein G9C98_003024 [Cotesia typhae]